MKQGKTHYLEAAWEFMAAWLIIETQKAAISRKWIQSALHMNE